METETRNPIQEPDYRYQSIVSATSLPNQTAQELLQNADKIYIWLTNVPKKKSWVQEQFEKDEIKWERISNNLI